MKIVISSTGKKIEGKVNPQFGRSTYFVIVETEDKKIAKTSFFENNSANQTGGAGILTAQKVVETGAQAVITGNIGPKAMDVLKQFNIPIFSYEGLIKDAINSFLENKLKPIN